MRNTIIFIIILVAGIFIFYTVFNNTKPQPTEVPIGEVITLSESGQVKGISIDGDKLTVTKMDGTQIVTFKEPNATLADYTKLGLVTTGVEITTANNSGINWGSILINFLV